MSPVGSLIFNSNSKTQTQRLKLKTDGSFLPGTAKAGILLYAVEFAVMRTGNSGN
jgi:hypothetical protein